MLSQRVNKIIVILLIFTILSVALLAAVVTYKPDIHTATLEQLCDIRGIDETLSIRVLNYLKSNPNADIDDIDVVKGFGIYRINLLKERYGD